MAPPRGLSLPVKNPKHIVPDVPWPVQTLIKFDQPVWSLQGDLWFKRSFFCHFRPHWRLMAPPRGLSGPRKRSKHIAPYVPWPDQTLIIFDQPVWSLQGDFCLQKVFLIIFCHFWPFLATLTACGAPQRPSRTQEKAQTYCPRRVLAGSNLDQV